MSSLATFFSGGGSVPIGGLVALHGNAVSLAGNRFDIGNQTYFKTGYTEAATESNIRGYGSGGLPVNPPNMPSYCRASVLVGSTLLMFPNTASTSFYTTTDGKTYGTRTLPASMEIWTAFHDDITNITVILNRSGQFYKSTDGGNTWGAGTTIPGGNNDVYGCITHTGTKFILVRSGTNTIWSSTDGLTWTSSTPTGLGDAGNNSKICSDRAGRVIIAKYSGPGPSPGTKLYTSSDHGTTFTLVNSTYSLHGGSSGNASSVTLYYSKQFNCYMYAGLTYYDAGSSNFQNSMSVAISIDGVNFTPCLNPTNMTSVSTLNIGFTGYAPILCGDPRTKNWSVFIDSRGSYTPGVPYDQTVNRTILDPNITLSTGHTLGGTHVLHRLADNETCFPFFADTINTRIVKTYKEFNYLPVLVVGSDTIISDSSSVNTKFYMRVK